MFPSVDMAESALESLGKGGRAPRGSNHPVRPGGLHRQRWSVEESVRRRAANVPVSEALGEKSFQGRDAFAARASTAGCARTVKSESCIASGGTHGLTPGRPGSIRPTGKPSDLGAGSHAPDTLAAGRYFSTLPKW